MFQVLMKTIGVIFFAAMSYALPNHPRSQLTDNVLPLFVAREGWGANSPTGAVTPLNTPVEYVVIHHTYIPGICMTKSACIQAMRAMQNYHQNDNGWFDIGYNFAVDGEGSVYEGRGWHAVGAHAAGTNAVSIGIAIIGDFRTSLPPAIALQATKQLIDEGVRRGIIRADYKLVGHREVGNTECPGDALFQEIQTWEHFTCDSCGSIDTEENSFTFVSRAEWGASPPRSITQLSTPATHVIIHHSVVPGVCMSRAQCTRDMRSMQNVHQNTNGWVDIGYNFAVGGEGSVYEGRGWDAVGAHAVNFNSRSIGIVIIGNFVSQMPPSATLQSARLLIAAGVQRGSIRADYRLVGHRQLAATECPGNALFREIQTWERFSSTP